jgi:hypothetical protein
MSGENYFDASRRNGMRIRPSGHYRGKHVSQKSVLVKASSPRHDASNGAPSYVVSTDPLIDLHCVVDRRINV